MRSPVELRRSDRQGHARLSAGDRGTRRRRTRRIRGTSSRSPGASRRPSGSQRGSRERRQPITPARGPGPGEGVPRPPALGSPGPRRRVAQERVPGIRNDMFQAFTYQGKFVFKWASGLDRAAGQVVQADERRLLHPTGPARPRPRRLIPTGRRERDTPIPPARPRERGHDRCHRGRSRGPPYRGLASSTWPQARSPCSAASPLAPGRVSLGFTVAPARGRAVLRVRGAVTVGHRARGLPPLRTAAPLAKLSSPRSASS